MVTYNKRKVRWSRLCSICNEYSYVKIDNGYPRYGVYFCEKCFVNHVFETFGIFYKYQKEIKEL